MSHFSCKDSGHQTTDINFDSGGNPLSLNTAVTGKVFLFRIMKWEIIKIRRKVGYAHSLLCISHRFCPRPAVMNLLSFRSHSPLAKHVLSGFAAAQRLISAHNFCQVDC